MSKRDQIERDFTYNSHPSTEQIRKMGTINNLAKLLSVYIDESMPDCREKSSALTKVKEAAFWANQGISHLEGLEGV